MNEKIELLDCTLRDGSYIVNGDFGAATIHGIIKRLQESKVEIIECGWLKDAPHKYGTAYYHTPDDLIQYINGIKKSNSIFVAMIDYNRYNLENLPPCDGKSIDAIRIAFPKDKIEEGLALVKPIREKGYRVFLQAANTLGYSDSMILKLIEGVNSEKPEGLSIVDTFGAMYSDDLNRIISLFSHNLDPEIKIGLHGHNNLQLSFALAIEFIEKMMAAQRTIVVDSSLCGMGRGAGNACTELVCSFLDRKYNKDYDMNTLMDTIDIYMTKFIKNWSWGYSTPYFISGTFQAHVNNISYLLKTHKTKARDMKNIIESLDDEKRREYDYEFLEKTYVDYMAKEINDDDVKDKLRNDITCSNVVLIAPGNTAYVDKKNIDKYIVRNNAKVIGINTIIPGFNYDYLFFSNAVRYDYAKEYSPQVFENTKKIVTSNIICCDDKNVFFINYNNLIKRGWKHFDNAMLLCLRFLDSILPSSIAVAGFDGYFEDKNYFEDNLEVHISREEKEILNLELKEMMIDFINHMDNRIDLKFITRSNFDVLGEKK